MTTAVCADGLALAFLGEHPDIIDAGGVRYSVDGTDSLILRADVWLRFLGWCLLHECLAPDTVYRALDSALQAMEKDVEP